MEKDTEWLPLDPTRAKYGAKWGRYMAGVALLERAGGVVFICGLMSCADRASAERYAESCRGSRRDLDNGHVSRATFESWVAAAVENGEA